MKNWLTDLFTKPKWETIARGSVEITYTKTFFNRVVNKETVPFLLRITTNLANQKYECFYIESNTRVPLDIELIIAQYPEVVRVLENNNINY